MKLLATLIVATYGQDYDFYSSGEAYRFGSVGDFSHTQSRPVASQADGSAPPIDSDGNVPADATDDENDPNLNSQAAHLFGEFADAVRYLRYGHGGNRRFCHTTRNNRAVYNWTSHKYGGYFAEGRNFMECMGEELYCFIEERAHYGQIIGITAGCEQMMNHPSVTIQDQQQLIDNDYTQINAIKNNYNQEAARGGANRHGFFTYYGLGGCLAMPAQNGHHMTNDRFRPPARGNNPELNTGDQTWETASPNHHRTGVDSAAWRSYKWLNYYRNYHGGYGQNQCLRFPKQRLSDDGTFGTVDPGTVASCSASGNLQDCYGSGDMPESCGKRIAPTFTYTSPGNLLPFGVSVCRACCVAQFYSYNETSNAMVDTTSGNGHVLYNTDGTGGVQEMLCNYPPDTDAVIVANTNEQFEELIPRFDMAGAAYNAFQVPNEINKVMMDDRDNNLFVHGSWCSEAGPARGCARIPHWTADEGIDNNYVYGTDLSADATASGVNWRYTCDQTFRGSAASGAESVGIAGGGLQPIGAHHNRDWCPGRPWLATSHDDESHDKPGASNANIVG